MFAGTSTCRFIAAGLASDIRKGCMLYSAAWGAGGTIDGTGCCGPCDSFDTLPLLSGTAVESVCVSTGAVPMWG